MLADDEFEMIMEGSDLEVTAFELEPQFAEFDPKKKRKKHKKRAKQGLLRCQWCFGHIKLNSKFVQTAGDRGPVHYECLDDWLDWHAGESQA